MRARMVEIFALEIDLRPANVIRQALCEVERRWTADKGLEVPRHFRRKFRVAPGILIGIRQGENERHQRF